MLCLHLENSFFVIICHSSMFVMHVIMRHPLRENVRFFADGASARVTGLRPCKRCLPDDVARDERAVIKAIAAAEGVTEQAITAAIRRGLENMKKYLKNVL